MCHHTISACCALLLLSLQAAAGDPPTLREILADSSLLKANCDLLDARDSALDGKPFRVELYGCRDDKSPDLAIVRIQFQKKELLLPGERFARPYPSGYEPRAGYAPDPILLVNNGSGGNGWNANQFYVVSLSDKTPLKLLGRVSRCEGAEKHLALSVVDDLWELGAGLLPHAVAPGAHIYLKAKNGRLIPERPNPPSEAGTVECRDLRDMLSRFLQYRDAGEQEKGWKILQANLRKNYPKEVSVPDAGPVPTEEFIESLKKTIDQRPLEPWLTEVSAADYDGLNYLAGKG